MSPAKKHKVTALAGGIGASKLLLGLYGAMDPHDLTVIVNTGDDIVLHGLKISPDLDIVTYTLAGLVNPVTGWGMRGETFHFLKRLGSYGREIWFNLGDRDLATHIHRTDLIAHGKTLTQAAESIRIALGVKSRILPMSDQPIPTIIETRDGNMHFQEYLIKHRTEPGVRGIHFAGLNTRTPLRAFSNRFAMRTESSSVPATRLSASARSWPCRASANNSAPAKKASSRFARSSAANR